MDAGLIVSFSCLDGDIPYSDFCFTFTGQIEVLADLCQRRGVLPVTHNCRLNINKTSFLCD